MQTALSWHMGFILSVCNEKADRSNICRPFSNHYHKRTMLL
uniref:Uncharacterized protein n=1 Tax=Siphoviridae sp. ct96x5 TaxID=2825367 RepID=A0A8S5PSU1_9CAUD|nr:MAG TPA: hypothetical protein [Siphoviridae sp. ct96x5]